MLVDFVECILIISCSLCNSFSLDYYSRVYICEFSMVVTVSVVLSMLETKFFVCGIAE